MIETIILRTAAPVRWRLVADRDLSDDEFLAVCRANPDMRPVPSRLA